ncbi:RecX family transcriptional regulator [Jiella sonneratiae]|uniref:Regulatory protein RecX n=1 Tax=Jiella sonneratiae TaxID=2816856 RepID=A0ABS3J320_9HYPH|nr:RecX family transcriptional regulator [Jiella sonneratiae]MBO0904067.1 RecX family transcriptional regulator [Jiella sonneratiae]
MATDPRTPRPISQEWLMRAAAHYLERYATSTDNLRRVLRRKLRRRALASGEATDGHEPLVEAVVARFSELGLLDDRRYAEAQLSSLRRKGASRMAAAARLSGKGVPREVVETALAGDETAETAAAAAYVRRRRFGRFRTPGRGGRPDDDRRRREIAAMVRAGFPMALAITAIDAGGDGDDPDEPAGES